MKNRESTQTSLVLALHTVLMHLVKFISVLRIIHLTTFKKTSSKIKHNLKKRKKQILTEDNHFPGPVSTLISFILQTSVRYDLLPSIY